MSERFYAIVVGAGPGGIAVVGSLLDSLSSSSSLSSSTHSTLSSSPASSVSTPPSRIFSEPSASLPRIAWIDPLFRGGRINAKYREVPSNTKVGLFLEYANATSIFRDVLAQTPAPNAVSALEQLPPDDTCQLGRAGDMLMQLTDGMALDERIEPVRGTVTKARWDEQSALWTVTVTSADSGGDSVSHAAPMLVYCTGAAPTTIRLPDATPQQLDLDTALAPSVLAQILPADQPATIGVIGASHSAVLVLMNLVTLAQSTHPHLRIRWFTRHSKLRFAEYKEGWILYDNTGLKGHAAEYARRQLDGDRLSTSEAGRYITRVDCAGGPDLEQDALRRALPACQYVVQAVGYSNVPLPDTDGIARAKFDHETGGFVDAETGAAVRGLFGAGIAFPERVVDRAGNAEYAVGFWKFMRFLKKVVPQWVEASRGG